MRLSLRMALLMIPQLLALSFGSYYNRTRSITAVVVSDKTATMFWHERWIAQESRIQVFSEYSD